ncbi:MAG: RNase P subunit p30 family protein [Candidatus Altiarchaeota archaeon]|nr:RNase P subunit p30 family protein [Candidatus Altiarchaeota archaeon]
MHKYCNLHVGWSREYGEKLDRLESLGWDCVCFTKELGSGFRDFLGEVEALRADSSLELYTGALVNKPVRRNARKALDNADLVFVEGQAREASECWEVDVISRPEKEAERDFMKQRDSGVDHIIAKNTSERFIALELNFSDILHSKGRARATLLGRIRQNIKVALKYNTPLVFTTGSDKPSDLRSPREMVSLARVLGLSEEAAKATLLSTPYRLIQKSRKRRDPNTILKGLEVVDWGTLKKPPGKKMYGWY